MKLHRRDLMCAAATGAATTLVPGICGAHATAAEPTTSMGLVIYCCRIRRQYLKKQPRQTDLYEPTQFLDYCSSVGAGGMQIPLGILEAEEALRLRNRAESLGLYIEAIVTPPKRKTDVARFETQLKTASAVGARAARTVIIPGRRYEVFTSLEAYRKADALGRLSLELATPIAEKYRVPLAVENHKDHRNAERIALFERISSEYVGACVDTGNSFSLLEDPLETVEALAPWAKSVHLKDQAVQPYDSGFLLADIPLGQGLLDLKKMVAVLKKAQPTVKFTLELITRDPLKVPCLTDKYWITLSDVSGSSLARTLRAVHAGADDKLPFPASMTPEDRLTLEDANLKASLAYAREHLGLVP